MSVLQSNMTQEELIELHVRMTSQCRKIMKAKNDDYTGKSADVFANFRMTESLGVPMEIGILIRMMDKIQRVRSFAMHGTLEVENESAYDALQDIINYAVLIQGVIMEKEKGRSDVRTTKARTGGQVSPT